MNLADFFFVFFVQGTLSRHTSLFNGAQQDAQESLQYIVDCLHEDLNRVKKKPYVPAIEDEAGKSDQVGSVFGIRI